MPSAVEQAAAKALSRARGQQAPAEAVRLVRSAGRAALADGLADERATFLRLRDSDQAKALRHVFFAERAAAKVAGLEGVEPRPVQTIGIVGTGLMGSGIAVAALDAGYRVIGVEQTAEAATKGRDRIAALLDRAMKSGRLDAGGRDERLGRLTVTGEREELADADLVIEAVFDDLAVKTELFARLDGIVRPDAILATNTSYLDPGRDRRRDVAAGARARPAFLFAGQHHAAGRGGALRQDRARRAGDRHRRRAKSSASCRSSAASAKGSSATASSRPIAARPNS